MIAQVNVVSEVVEAGRAVFRETFFSPTNAEPQASPKPVNAGDRVVHLGSSLLAPGLRLPLPR
jgi:hypothetical protein